MKGPGGERKLCDSRRQDFPGYAARGVTRGRDDGTLVLWAAATCLAHEPEAALAGLHAMLGGFPQALRDRQCVGAINPSLPGGSLAGWVALACFEPDQGLVVMMIENARSGLIWRPTRSSPIFSKGLKGLSFKAGWLG